MNISVPSIKKTKNITSTRNRADARRQRILEKSQFRIDMVSGKLKNDKQEIVPKEKLTSWQKRRQLKKRYSPKNKSIELISNQCIKKATNNNEVIEKMCFCDHSRTSDESLPIISLNSRKYQGVIKIRRKMIADRKSLSKSFSQKNHNQLKANNTGSNSKTSSSIPPYLKRRFPITPIIINLITVFCLFCVGYDVGLQNHPLNRSVVVKSELIWNENKSMPLVIFQRKPTILTNRGEMFEKFFFFKEDIFSTETLDRDTIYRHEKKKTISPASRTDANNISSEPCSVNGSSRFAIQIKSNLIYLFITVPTYILLMILSIPLKLFKYPPILMICSIIIRLLGRHVFHGIVPSIQEMLDVKAGKKIITSEGSVVRITSVSAAQVLNSTSKSHNLSEATKKIIKNFLDTRFPTVLIAYTIFQDVKNDMFIVLFGFLTGIVFPTDSPTKGFISHEL